MNSLVILFDSNVDFVGGRKMTSALPLRTKLLIGGLAMVAMALITLIDFLPGLLDDAMNYNDFEIAQDVHFDSLKCRIYNFVAISCIMKFTTLSDNVTHELATMQFGISVLAEDTLVQSTHDYSVFSTFNSIELDTMVGRTAFICLMVFMLAFGLLALVKFFYSFDS